MEGQTTSVKGQTLSGADGSHEESMTEVLKKNTEPCCPYPGYIAAIALCAMFVPLAIALLTYSVFLWFEKRKGRDKRHRGTY